MDSSSATAARLIGSRLPSIKRMRATVRLPAGQMADAARSRFMELAQNLSAQEKALLDSSLPAAAAQARHAAGHWAFEGPSRAVEALVARLFPEHQIEELNRIRVAIIARLVLEHSEVEDQLPASVLSLYPAFFDRLAEFLAKTTSRSYRPDFFCKDVRYALGLTVPCGLLQIDLRYRIGPRLILREMIRSGLPKTAWDYVLSCAWGRWYNTHLDPRDMGEFNPAGWIASFCRVAEMLELNPTVCGAAGASWFYDPVVSEISPELAYVRRNQVENGAFSVRLGEAPQHIKNALFASRTRQELCDQGKYVPMGFLIAWPRRALIGWADSR
jgi:hypothetical protein